MKKKDDAPGDDAVIELLTATVKHYRQELEEVSDPNQLRMEVLRRLDLISQTLKGLLKGRQPALFGP